MPATVVMTCVTALTSRMRLLSVSAMNRSPLASTATPVGIVQFGVGGQSAVAAIAAGSVAGDGGNDVRARVDFANAVVVGVGDEQVSAGVHCYAAGIVQFGDSGQPAVAAIAFRTVAGDRADEPRTASARAAAQKIKAVAIVRGE